MTNKLTKTNSIAKRMISFLLAVICFCTILAPMTANAASGSSRTYKNRPLYASGGFKILDVYGEDKIVVNYSKNKIQSVSVSQTAKALGSNIIQKGGIKCISNSSTKAVYETTWYVNFTVMPKALMGIAKIVYPKASMLFNLGRIGTMRIRYTVTGTGSVTSSVSYKKLQVPSKLESVAKGFLKYFTKIF